MLSQADIDSLVITMQSGEPAYIYYVAHMIEGRETDILDEHSYKDISKFKVVKVEVQNIENAYFEYLNYVKNPDNYHIEEEEFYYHPSAKYMQCFIAPNNEEPYGRLIAVRKDGNKYRNIVAVSDNDNKYKDIILMKHKYVDGKNELSIASEEDIAKSKDIYGRTPSIVYGFIRKVYDVHGNIKEVHDPSPVKAVYTNALEFGNKSNPEIVQDILSGYLNWKYMTLDEPVIVDGIEYNYVTSDWYILTLKNYPMIEKPLINVKQRSGYFMDLQDAFRYIEQLIA